MAEALEYRGYRIETSPLGRGWRASIYAPGAMSPLPESLAVLEKASKEDVVARAKGVVDSILNPMSS
jgi:hypothetical protein